MKNKTIYILRHGETDYNKNGIVQGRGIDIYLNDTGLKQAKQAYEMLKAVDFDVVFTSKLIRTHQTVKKFIQNGLHHQIHEGLDEISWGNQEGLKADQKTKNSYATIIANWRDGKLNERVGGGETPLDVMMRQKEAFKEILAYCGEKILICMHGRAIRILLCWLLNYPLNFMDGFPHQNCALYKLNQQGNQFFIEVFNETAHLT